MSIYLVHAGLLLGGALFVVGLSFLVIGFCRYATEQLACQNLISWWERVWTKGRVGSVFVLALMAVFLGPLAWPQRPSGGDHPMNGQNGNCNVQNSEDVTVNCPPPNGSAAPRTPGPVTVGDPKDCPPGYLKMDSNTATGNGGDGFSFPADARVCLVNNKADNNGRAGFDMRPSGK